jgi:hypothetical protein
MPRKRAAGAQDVAKMRCIPSVVRSGNLPAVIMTDRVAA